MIRTVLGDIRKEELGRTLAHEHFIIDLSKVRHDNFSLIETVEEVVPEIKLAMATGIDAAFEVSTIDLSRDVLKLREKAVAFQADEFSLFIAEQINPGFCYFKQFNISSDDLLHVLQRIGYKSNGREFSRFSDYDTNFF